MAVEFPCTFGDSQRSARLTGLKTGTQQPKEYFVMRMVTLITFLLASSALYPALAQDNAKPSVSSEQQKSMDQSGPDNRAVDRDWKLKPSDDQQTVGKVDGKSPDSADHYDQKIDRNWRAEPRSDDKNRQ
jgi:hypothetical protein